MSTFAIETKQLKKVYKPLIGGSGLVAVDQLSLQVPQGQVFGFLGPNGAGKTTTIQMLLGNVFPTGGSARVMGYPAGDLRAKRKIGFLPEKFQFHDFLTASEFLRLHGKLAKMDSRRLHDRIDEALTLVGLYERRNSKIREFSKGMQQRAGLAQAILHDPELVILDEPTSALDPLGRRSVREVVQHLKEQGKTVFLNSHLLSEIEMTCDYVAIINKGQVIKQGKLEDLLTDRSTVELEIRNLSAQILESLSRISPKVTQEDETLVRVELADETRVPELAKAVVETGGELFSMQVKRESLEDLFIRAVEEAS